MGDLGSASGTATTMLVLREVQWEDQILRKVTVFLF